MNKLNKSLAVFNWASARAVKDLTNRITKEKLQASYDIQEEIGRGAFGIVKKCERKADKAMFAIKIILFKDPKLLNDIEREIAMMRKLSHDSLVTLHEAYESAGSVAIVLDYIAGGELFEKIIAKEYLTEKEAVCYLRHLLEGLAYMHSKNIVHLDIKPENILCVGSNSYSIKLIDFGLARELKPGEITRCALGTPDFIAPEAISYKQIKTETDMWSVGVLTYVLLSGLMPFGGDTDHETLSNIANVDWDFDEDSFCEISSDAQDFIESLLVLHPEDRMTSADALEHHWIHENKQRVRRINTKRHRTFLARRRWKKSVNVVTAVRKLCQMLQISANGRSQNQKPTEVRNQVLSSPSQCLPDEVTSVSGHKRFEKPRCSPSVVADKKSTPHVSGFSNLRKNMYDNETTTCKDNADEFEVGEINKSDKKDNSKKVEDGIFSNVSLPQSKTNSEKIMWKVLK